MTRTSLYMLALLQFTDETQTNTDWYAQEDTTQAIVKQILNRTLCGHLIMNSYVIKILLTLKVLALRSFTKNKTSISTVIKY